MTTESNLIAPLAAAQARAATDTAFAALLKESGKAGAIVGAATNNKAATEFFKTLADQIAAPAMVILGMRKQGDDDDKEKKLPTAEAAPVRLLELCGLVNHAIAEAQTEARRSAIRRMKAAELQKAAKNARNAVIEKMRRNLAPYGLVVDFQAATCRVGDVESAKSDAEKAADRIKSAFSLDMRGALDGLASLDAQQWAFVVAHVARLELERQAEAAKENEAGLKAACEQIRANIKEFKGKSDLVSLANAEQALTEAEENHKRALSRVADLDKQLKAA